MKTDVSPSNYLEILATRELQEEDKLPASVMRQWKEANDQSSFKYRIDHGPKSNDGLRFMKENYLKVVQSRPARSVEKGTSSSSGKTRDTSTPVMVPETTVEAVTEVLKDFPIVPMPDKLKSLQGTGGDAETNEVEVLNRLCDSPTSFSFESHGRGLPL